MSLLKYVCKKNRKGFLRKLQFNSCSVTLALAGQCPVSNCSTYYNMFKFDTVLHTTICSSFKLVDPLFLELSCTHTSQVYDVMRSLNSVCELI